MRLVCVDRRDQSKAHHSQLVKSKCVARAIPASSAPIPLVNGRPFWSDRNNEPFDLTQPDGRLRLQIDRDCQPARTRPTALSVPGSPISRNVQILEFVEAGSASRPRWRLQR